MITTPAPRAWLAAVFLAVACFVLLTAAPKAVSEQASSNARSAQAGYLDAGDEHTCAVCGPVANVAEPPAPASS